MTVAGIDIGSRSIALVVRENGATVAQRLLPTTFDPVRQITAILSGIQASHIVATGYGRGLVTEDVFSPAAARPLTAGEDSNTDFPLTPPKDIHSITEIKAHGLGAAHLFPQARSVLDIGGQDTKAIALSPAGNGKVMRFEMNDRCAAGTGKFLEHTANVFQIPVEEFGTYALSGDTPPIINSMCTVFAETEATSLMAQGIAPANIALGLHVSIARRTVTMLRRTGFEPPLVFSGGVAKNPCIRHLLCKELTLKEGDTLLFAGADARTETDPPHERGTSVTLPESASRYSPDMTGALGAAMWAETMV